MHFPGVSCYSNNISKEIRNENLKKFVSGDSKILITTQVLARGVPFDGVNVVVNFDIPTKDMNLFSMDKTNFLNQISRCTPLGREKGFAFSFTSTNGPQIDRVVKCYNIKSIKI